LFEVTPSQGKSLWLPLSRRSLAKVTVVFVDEDPKASIEAGIKGQTNKVIYPRAGVIYVHYPNRMSTSKLKLIGAAQGTARNMNTAAKMVVLTALAFR
jgi:uncharacterized protein (DUF1697 family)